MKRRFITNHIIAVKKCLNYIFCNKLIGLLCYNFLIFKYYLG